jgi:hypothetical protein
MALLHPLIECAQVRPAVEAAKHLVGPAGHHEQVGVGQGQVRPEQIRTSAEPLIDIVELLADLSDDQLLHLVGRVGIEEEAETLVQLGSDEIDHLEDAVAAEIAHRREHFGPVGAVAEVLEDDRILGQHLAAVELERRNCSLGIDGKIVAAVFERLALQVDAHGIMVEADLVEQDVRGLAARARRIIELHLPLLLVAVAEVVHVGIVVAFRKLAIGRDAAFIRRKRFNLCVGRKLVRRDIIVDRHVIVLDRLRLAAGGRCRCRKGQCQDASCISHS